MRRTAVQTAVHVITAAALIALLTGIAMKLPWFGLNPLSDPTRCNRPGPPGLGPFRRPGRRGRGY